MIFCSNYELLNKRVRSSLNAEFSEESSSENIDVAPASRIFQMPTGHWAAS